MKAYSNLIRKPDEVNQNQKKEEWGFYMEDGKKKKEDSKEKIDESNEKKDDNQEKKEDSKEK